MNEVKIPEQIQERIREYEDNLERWTYYELLYVTRSASNDDIKRAYRKVVQLMHPDRHGLGLNPEDKSKLEKIFNEINIAYNVLSNESERMKYDQTLIYAEDHGQPLKVSTDEQVAQAQYKRGVQSLKSNDIVKAIEFFKSATQLDPGKPDYHAKLAFALISHPNPRIRKDALNACKEAIKMNQENPNYHALMGKVYHVLGDLESAEVHFRRALSWNPQHALARKELKNVLDEKSKLQPGSIKDKILKFLKRK